MPSSVVPTLQRDSILVGWDVDESRIERTCCRYVPLFADLEVRALRNRTDASHPGRYDVAVFSFFTRLPALDVPCLLLYYPFLFSTQVLLVLIEKVQIIDTMSEPQQTPTPEKTPAKGRPQPPSRSNSEMSTASADADGDDQGYQSRSRSQSRRRRRQNQRQRQSQGKAQAGNAQAESMAQIPEAEDEEPQQQQLTNPATQDTTEAQPFDYIKPPSESMNGPVTYARMNRGEIPWRGKPPTQNWEMTQGTEGKTKEKDPMDQDGLKLRIELNLDIEIELKAHIHGDLTLALLFVPLLLTDSFLIADTVIQGLIYLCQR